MPDLMYVGFAIWGVILGGGGYLGLRFVRAFERRQDNQTALSALAQRLTALEDSMESLRGDVERLNDGHEFTTRLLTSRSQRSEAVGDPRRDY